MENKPRSGFTENLPKPQYGIPGVPNRLFHDEINYLKNYCSKDVKALALISDIDRSQVNLRVVQYGQTFLHRAADLWNPKSRNILVGFLANQADMKPLFNTQDSEGKTAIAHTIIHIIQEIRTSRAGFVFEETEATGSFFHLRRCGVDLGGVLHEASRYHCPELLQWLIVCCAADISERGVEGMTPLLSACLHGHAANVDLLMRYHVNICATNCNGESPLYLLAKGKHYFAMSLFLHNIKNHPEQARILNMVTNDKNSALHAAAELPIETSYAVPRVMMRKLIESGIDHRLKNEWGNTAEDVYLDTLRKKGVAVPGDGIQLEQNRGVLSSLLIKAKGTLKMRQPRYR